MASVSARTIRFVRKKMSRSEKKGLLDAVENAHRLHEHKIRDK